jgi:hypothetical protein
VGEVRRLAAKAGWLLTKAFPKAEKRVGIDDLPDESEKAPDKKRKVHDEVGKVPVESYKVPVWNGKVPDKDSMSILCERILKMIMK